MATRKIEGFVPQQDAEQNYTDALFTSIEPDEKFASDFGPFNEVVMVVFEGDREPIFTQSEVKAMLEAGEAMRQNFCIDTRVKWDKAKALLPTSKT